VLKLQKWFEIFQSSFHMSNLKNRSPKKYEIKETNISNPNQFMDSQNLLYNLIKWISNLIFSPRSSIFEAHFHFQEPLTLRKVKIAVNTLAQNLE